MAVSGFCHLQGWWDRRKLCEADEQNNAQTQNHFIDNLSVFMTTQGLPRDSQLKPRWRRWRKVIRGQRRENRG